MASKGANVLHKALGLLDLFEDHGSWGLSEVAHTTGLPKATALRLLSALEEHGLLSRTPDRQYRLGLRLIRLGAQVAEALDVRRLAVPYMRDLRDLTGQSVQLAVIDGDEGVYVERFEGTTAVRLYIAVGRRAPLYAGASTRLLLAYCTPERQAEILAAKPPQPHTPTTVTDPIKLQELLQQTRTRGWTISLGELQPDSAEMAAPIFDYRGRVIAAVSIAGPDRLYGPEFIPEYLPPLRAAAQAISREMGHHVFGGGHA